MIHYPKLSFSGLICQRAISRVHFPQKVVVIPLTFFAQSFRNQFKKLLIVSRHFFFVFKSCLWQPNETVWQNRNHESWTHEEASLSSSEQRVRFLFETSRIDAYSRLYFILAQGQKTTILHESFKERIDFLTATCRTDSEKNEREKLILFINKWFLSLECALQNCQTFLSFGELKSKIECLTVRCFSNVHQLH